MRTKILILFLAVAPVMVQAQVNYSIDGNTAYVTNSPSAAGDIVITNIYDGYPVTSIGEEAFQHCLGLMSVTIGNSVTNIGDYAFAGCFSLTSAIFQGNAPALGVDTFDFVPGNAKVYYYYGTSGWSSTYGGLPTVMLGAPAPQVGSGSIGVQSGIFGFTLTGVTNQTIVVETSTNLVNWQPIWTNMFSSTSTNFTDAQWKNYPSRFYRISSP